MASFFGSREKASEPSGHQPAPHHPPGAMTPEQHAAYQAAPEPEPAPPHSDASPQAAPGEQPDAETLEKIAALRAKLHETFGKVSLAMMTVPRYRHLPFGEMTSLILDPLIRDRIAMAAPTKDGVPVNGALTGVAIWASVSPEVDAKIVDQIRARNVSDPVAAGGVDERRYSLVVGCRGADASAYGGGDREFQASAGKPEYSSRLVSYASPHTPSHC